MHHSNLPGIAASLTLEARVLLLGARVRMDGNSRASLDELLTHELDWSRVQELAQYHGVLQILYSNLFRYYRGKVPADVLEAFRAQADRNSMENLIRTHEVVKIIRALEGQDIPVIPFKGPILAQMAYGNPTLRAFHDLDIMVRRSDVLRAKQVLIDQGFTPYHEMNPEEEQAYIDTGLGYEFYATHAGLILFELHWTFFYHIYALELDPDEMWAQHQQFSFAGATVRTMAPHHLLLYLCTHGTKHRWHRVRWICDVAELVRTQTGMDWDLVYRESERLGLRRMLLLGLYLAGSLLGAPVPDQIWPAVRKDPTILWMANRICKDWLLGSADRREDSSAGVFWFHFRERERLRDRVPYVRHHLHLALRSARYRWVNAGDFLTGKTKSLRSPLPT